MSSWNQKSARLTLCFCSGVSLGSVALPGRGPHVLPVHRARSQACPVPRRQKASAGGLSRALRGIVALMSHSLSPRAPRPEQRQSAGRFDGLRLFRTDPPRRWRGRIATRACRAAWRLSQERLWAGWAQACILGDGDPTRMCHTESLLRHPGAPLRVWQGEANDRLVGQPTRPPPSGQTPGPQRGLQGPRGGDPDVL